MPDLTAQLPAALRRNARWERLGPDGVPAMLVHPDWDSGEKVPFILWMHGRTVSKELDPGRYLRWMRAPGGGIGACAVDLPGHGERFIAALQEPEHAFEVIEQMAGEIDGILEALDDFKVFDLDLPGVGGMSGGGMAALVRLTREKPHPFICASVEAASGSWEHERHRKAFREVSADIFHAANPIENLRNWRDIPFQAIHATGDEWVAVEGQRAFVEAVRERATDASQVEMIEFENTGAPNEHAGFGRMAAEAKNRQIEFFRRHLRPA